MLGKEVIYWIGGSACAGKSTLAQMYAAKYGYDLYSCDQHFNDHLKKISAKSHPAMYKVSEMSANEAFYTREITEQLRVYIQSFKEDFSFVINDIASMLDKPIVVEGNQLLPSLVFPYLNEQQKGIWLVPTQNFQIVQYKKRKWIENILQNTEDPEVAFDNWMKRDASFAKLIYKEATDLNLNVIKVDGQKILSENFKLVEDYFNG